MRRMTIAALAAALALSVAPQAMAQVDEAMLAQLKALMAEQQIELNWTGTETYPNADGDEVTALTGVTMTVQGDTIELPAIEFGDVEQTDIGWRIETVTLPSYSFSEEDRNIWIEKVQVEGMKVPAAGKKLPYGGMTMYETVSMANLILSIGGAEVVKMSDFHMEVAEPTGSTPLEFSGAAEAMSVDFSTMPDPQSRAMLELLGYLKMEGFFEMGGSWNPADGQMSLSQFDLTVNNAGTLGIALDLGGYTTAFIEQMQAMQAQLAANPGGDNSAAGLAMLGMMQQLTFNTARISFFDDSLTSKVLGMVAKMQNVEPSVIANQAKGLVPFLTMQLNNPELTNMVTQAVSTFIDDPKSLVITAEPAAPVPFAMIMSSAMSAPQTLPTQLNLKVKANE